MMALPRWLDVAVGTALGDGRSGTDSLCLDAPERVVAHHRAAHAAGAGVLKTNSFLIGLHPDPARLAHAAVACAREAADAPVWGAIGPAGDVRRAVDAFAVAGVDAVLLETFTDLQAHVDAVRHASGAGLVVVATACWLDDDAGQSAAMHAEALIEAGADVVGANCGAPETCLQAALAMRDATSRPVVAVFGRLPGTQPNLVAFAKCAFDGGVTAVGGCCGTTPDDLAGLRRDLRPRPASA